MATDVSQFIAELGGGVFEEKLSAALSEVAVAACDRGKPGRIQITMDVKPIGNGQQVSVTHKLSYAKPTMRGKTSEEDTTETPMYVGTKGKLSQFPENQTDMFAPSKNEKA